MNKKILIAALGLLFAISAWTQDNTPNYAWDVDKLNDIANDIDTLKLFTSPTPLASTDKDEWVGLILSLIAAVGTIGTFYAIHLTRKQREIKEAFQKGLLTDLVRHLYRNKVCVCTIQWKLQEKGYDKYYPSEEHLLKLKVLPEDLRLDRFDNTSKHYDTLHKLELLFRNYNTEADVALEHLKNPRLDKEVKERDMATLEFKSQYLTCKVIELMKLLNFHEDIVSILTKASDKVAQENVTVPYEQNLDRIPQRTSSRCRYYDDELKLSKILDRDIAIEYTKEGTINLIRFNNVNS